MTTSKIYASCLGVFFLGICPGITAAEPPPLQAVPFSSVDVRGDFWTGRQQVNREKTIPHLIEMCQREGRVRNLWRAAGKLDGDFEGTRLHDADLFKTIEAASYTLVLHPDTALDRRLDELVAAIAAAQRDDGYLHTYAQLRTRDSERPATLNLFASGHLIHAGVAHFEATGKKNLLVAAVRMADLIGSQYGEGKKIDVPAHPILESALLRLARVTGQDRYAKLAMFFLDERGCAERSGRKSYGVHAADDVPLRNLHEARGHVIITLFLLGGMVDGATRFGDQGLLAASRHVYDDAVTRRMYVTGAMGRQSDERFTEPYALDNRASIGEGCQSWALMQLAHRLLLIDADARYADVIERVMYNNLPANVGLDGKAFYYYNRLAARPEDATGRPYTGIVTETVTAHMPRNCLSRQPWFKVPCCPPNVAMAIAGIGQYAYAASPDAHARSSLRRVGKPPGGRDGRLASRRRIRWMP